MVEKMNISGGQKKNISVDQKNESFLLIRKMRYLVNFLTRLLYCHQKFTFSHQKINFSGVLIY